MCLVWVIPAFIVGCLIVAISTLMIVGIVKVCGRNG